MEKLCICCLYVKDIFEFGIHNGRRDGYQAYCKECRGIQRHNGVIVINPDYVKPIKKLIAVPCELCDGIHYGEYGSGRFCSSGCARSFSSKDKRAEINKRVSVTLTGRNLTDEHRKNIWKNRPRTAIQEKNNKNSRRGILTPINKVCLFCGGAFITKRECQQYCSYPHWVSHKKELSASFDLYRKQCNFTFNVYDYPELFDLSLLEEHGWYSASNRGGNTGGVSRDHRYSVKKGFDNGVDPMVLSHPLNCKLMIHLENNRKNTECSVRLEELTEQIKNFNALVAESG